MDSTTSQKSSINFVFGLTLIAFSAFVYFTWVAPNLHVRTEMSRYRCPHCGHDVYAGQAHVCK